MVVRTLESSCLYFQSKALLIAYIICPSWNTSIGTKPFNVAIQGNYTETSGMWPVKVKALDLDAYEHYDVMSNYSVICSCISKTCNYIPNEINKLANIICSTPLDAFLSFGQL